MSKKPPANWGEIASAYCAGTLSNRQIAKQFGIAESTLRKRIASEGWEKTGAQKVRTAAHTETAAPKRAVPIVAEAIPDDIEGRLLCLAERMTDELEQITAHQGEISEAIEIETMDDENPRRKEAMLKAITHPIRANSLKTIAQTVALLGRKRCRQKGQERAVEGCGRNGIFWPFRSHAPAKARGKQWQVTGRSKQALGRAKLLQSGPGLGKRSSRPLPLRHSLGQPHARPGKSALLPVKA